MIRQLLKHRNRQIIVDVSTQKDLFLSDGIARVRNHRRVLANIRRVMAYARSRKIHVISTCEVYTNGSGPVPYCLDGTEGLGNRFNARPMQVNEVACIAHHVGRSRRQLFNDCNSPVRKHEITDMNVTDMRDANAIKGLGPTGRYDFLFDNFNTFGIVATIEQATGQAVGSSGQQEVTNPGFAKFGGRFLSTACHDG
jgi:hypothetical protein